MVQVDVICVRCKENKIGVKERKFKRKDRIISGTLCTVCKNIALNKMREREKSTKSRKRNADRMKVDNPMFNPETRAKVAETVTGVKKNINDYTINRYMLPVETKEEQSLRMQINNPMHDECTRKKATETMRLRIASGEITYKKGEEHHLWKGNRDFNNTC